MPYWRPCTSRWPWSGANWKWSIQIDSGTLLFHLKVSEFLLCPLQQSKINSCVIPNSLKDLGRFLYRSPPELCLLCAPDSSATLSAICTGNIRNFMGHLHRDPPNLISHPEPSSISSAIYAGTVQNLISFLPETVWPEPFGTLSAISTRTLRNFISFLPRNPPEPHHPSAPEPSGTLSAICTGTLRNFISQLPQNCPEPHQPSAPEPSGTSSAICTGRLRNLLRNLVLQLHRMAPELFWAKDPIANFAVGEKKTTSLQDTSRPYHLWHLVTFCWVVHGHQFLHHWSSDLCSNWIAGLKPQQYSSWAWLSTPKKNKSRQMYANVTTVHLWLYDYRSFPSCFIDLNVYIVI